MTAISAGVSTYREVMLNADPQVPSVANDFDSFGRWASRRTRYDLYWGLYQNNVYQDILRPAIATTYKTVHGMPKWTRNVYSPAYRMGEFWAGRLMGGSLDREAGDGEGENSALPILTDNEAIRPAIARLWADSNWQVNKDLYCRFGSVLGDVGLIVDDDVRSGKVSVRIIHPGTLAWVSRDPATREITGYILQERRYDPRPGQKSTDVGMRSVTTIPRSVTYSEQVYLDGDTVRYLTTLDNEPYPWNGVSAQWDVPYGFIPLVIAQHETIGLDWGLSCFHCGLSRFREVDDQASGLGDQIRKAIRGPWLISGMSQPRTQPSIQGQGATPQNPQPDRAEMPFLYAPDKDVTATSLVFPLDIAGVTSHIDSLVRDIEKNFPELMADATTASGDASGRALRVARQLASSKVQARRASYDDALVRAQSMAIAIGGFRNYRDYEGFGLDSIANGKLDHRIGQRPVFETDPADDIEEEGAFLTNVNAAITAGIPLEFYLKRQGWSDKDLAELKAARAEADTKAKADAQSQADLAAKSKGIVDEAGKLSREDAAA